ncbi:unnamed protein product [Lota lota]
MVEYEYCPSSESPLTQVLQLITQTQESQTQAQNWKTQAMLDLAAHHAEERTVLRDLLRRTAGQSPSKADSADWGTCTPRPLHIVLPKMGACTAGSPGAHTGGLPFTYDHQLLEAAGWWLLPGKCTSQQVVEQVMLELFLRGLPSSTAEWVIYH